VIFNDSTISFILKSWVEAAFWGQQISIFAALFFFLRFYAVFDLILNTELICSY